MYGVSFRALTVFGLFKRASGAADQMESLNSKGTICAAGMEIPCRIRKASDSKMIVHLDRKAGLSGNVLVVDLKRHMAFDATIGTSQDNELTLSVRASHNLAGLVPARLSRARDLCKRS